MNIICESSRNVLNEGIVYDDWGSRNASFTKMDVVIGPDGTVYNTRLVVAYVNDACGILNKITKGVIASFLDALPIIYTFQVDTMATDGSRILINPGFVMELVRRCGNSPVGVAFVILHEVYHNVFKHAAREAADPVKFSDHDKANVAQDLEINWIIEHTFPDPRNENDAKAKGDSIYDANGEVKQIFGGITKRCNGWIDEKYKDDLWEEIYEKLDSVPKSDQPKPEEQKPIPMSADMKDGYKDGWEDAIRDLRAKGLVESVTVGLGFYDACVKMLTEALLPGKSKDYNAGYGLGYDAAMKAVMGMLMGGKGAGENGMMGSAPKLEPVGKDLTPIKPKFPINQSNSNSKGEQDPNVPIDLDKQNQSSSSNSNQSSNNQQSQSSQSGQGSSSQSQGQSQSGEEINGASGSGSGDDSKMQSQGNDGEGGTSSRPRMSQGEEQGKYRNGIAVRQGSSDEFDADKAGSSYDDVKDSDDDKMSPEEAIKTLSDLAKSGNPVKIGTADGGYSGKGDMSSTKSHTLTDGSAEAIAQAAGANTKAKKLDNPFKDPEKLKQLADSLDKISKINGGSKTGMPGRGISGIMGTIEEMLKPKIDWKEMLKDYIYGYFSELVDIGFSKKGLSRDAYYHINDYEGETANRLLVFIDTSGSMFSSGDDLKQCLAEINEICLGVGAYEVQVVQFCDGIYQVSTYNVGDLPEQIVYKNVRSGGTSYVEIFDYIEDMMDNDQMFNVAVIMTDSDCYYYGDNLAGRDRDPEDLSYANKIIWMIVDDNERPLPYWTEAEKVIYLNPKDFNKSLAFTTTSVENDNNDEVKESVKEEKEMKTKTPILAETVTPRRCINSKLNEDFIGSYDNDDFNYDETEDEQIANLVNSIDIHRVDAANVDLSEYKDDIVDWLRSGNNTNIQNIIFADDTNNPNNFYSYSYPVAVINSDYSVDVYGKLLIKAPEFPDYIFINSVKSLDANANHTAISGDFVATNGRYTELPTGFPERVDGFYKLLRLKNLRTLKNTPYEIGGSLIIQICPNLNNYTNHIKDLRGTVLSDRNITTEDILKSSIFANNVPKRTVEPADEELVDERVREALEYRKTKNVNEAFNSSIFRRLFNMPENKRALEALKKINVFWSEIPDDIILPCYNNVQKSLQLRRVVNKDVKGYGITIWCTAKDEIMVIGTGDNKSSYIDDDGKEQSWNGHSWLYYDSVLRDVLNSRIRLVRQANEGDQDAIESCKKLGINYEKKDIAARGYAGSIRDINTEMLFSHLYLVPDLCRKAYIIKGTNDIKDKTLNDPELYKNFSYTSQVSRRKTLHNDRLEAIRGMYISAKEQNRKSSLYNKYIDYLLTDEIQHNIFKTRMDIVTAINTIDEMIESTKSVADVVRKRIINLYNNNELDPLGVDELYDCLKNTNYRTFLKYADINRNILQKIAEEKGLMKKSNELDNYSNYRNLRSALYSDDINFVFLYPQGSLRADDKYYQYASEYKPEFVKYYITSAEGLAKILEAIEEFKNGSRRSFDNI